MARTGLGMDGSAAVRASFGIGCAALIGVSVWLLEHRSAYVFTENTAINPTQVRVSPTRLAIESTAPIAQWSVTCLGTAAVAERSDAHTWAGTISAPAGEDVLIQASGSNSMSPHRALRVVLGDRPEQVFWSDGDQTVTVVR